MKYKTSKVNLYVDLAEKVAWWERLKYFVLDEYKLANGLRECVRIFYEYELDSEEGVVSRISSLKPPQAEAYVLDYDNFKGSTVICIVLPIIELEHWRRLRNKHEYSSLEKMAKDAIRTVLSI